DNEALLKLLGRSDLPHPIGSSQPMGKPWGGEEPKDSPAAQFIIRHAKATPAGEKLTVVCTGATTNLASAIALAPEIADRLSVYLLGFRYEVATGVWNKSEFNIRRDLNAADYVLNLSGLELHIMPISVARKFAVSRSTAMGFHQQMGKLGEYLTDKWMTRAAENQTRIFWDVALVEAMLTPQHFTEAKVTTPPENTQRQVWMYTSIDADTVQSNFWNAVVPKK
ncbi:MAG: nucleoside hydrolase, partial [Planctomycetota bacterium]